METPSTPCTFCQSQTALYTCPRCQTRYCSLACYQSEPHSHCSEDFYHQETVQALKTQQADEEEKQRMLDILKRLSEFDDQVWAQWENDLEESTLDLQQRLQHVKVEE
ncbi:hypothetical protein IWQ61_002535, partial [Dispira simplex]